MNKKDIRASGWNYAFVPKDVFLSKELSHADVRLYCYLLWRSGTKDNSWPKVETMAVDVDMSYGSVKLSLKSLVRNNWIRRERNFEGSSTTWIFETQDDCLSANRIADVRLTGWPTVGQQDSRLNESQLTKIKEGAREEHSRPVREQTPRTPDPEITSLSEKFVALTGIPWPEPKTKAEWAKASKLWLTPLRGMARIANGQAEKILAEAVRQMRKDGLTIYAPASVEKVFVSIYGEKHKQMDAAASDPFASFNRMMDDRAAKDLSAGVPAQAEAGDENHR